MLTDDDWEIEIKPENKNLFSRTSILLARKTVIADELTENTGIFHSKIIVSAEVYL